MLKKFKMPTAIVTSLLLALGLAAAPAAAASAPKIEDVEYDGNGRVEVEFYGDVSYHNTSVTVKDKAGKKYSASIIKRDSDDIAFKIKNFKKGTKYKFTINGVAKYGSSHYTKVKGTVKIPSAKLIVEEVGYDIEDMTVDFEFKGNVNFNDPTITITDAAGNNYVTSIREVDNDSIEVNVNPLTIGETYSYEISNVKHAGQARYTSISGTFVAYDD